MGVEQGFFTRIGDDTQRIVVGVGPNDQLPSTSMTALMVGGRMTEPILGGRLAAQARLEVIPVAFFRQGGALFGKTSYTNGFATRFGLLYAVSDHVGLVGGYRFRLHHSRFRGRGAALRARCGSAGAVLLRVRRGGVPAHRADDVAERVVRHRRRGGAHVALGAVERRGVLG